MSTMSKKMFLDLMADGAPTSRPPTGKADWDAIYTECKEGQSDEPFTATRFFEVYVRGVVSKQRVRTKLEELHAQKKLLRIDYKGTYFYLWPEGELA